jgi:hypothetical protein
VLLSREASGVGAPSLSTGRCRRWPAGRLPAAFRLPHAARRLCAPGGRQVGPVHMIGRDQGAACRLVLKLVPLDDSVPGYITVAPAEVRSISSKVVHGPSRVPRTPP